MIQIIQANRSGIGFCGLLTIAFIVLKLIDKIDWSWWWVLAPLWLPAGFLLGISLVCLVIAGLVSACAFLKKVRS